MPELELDSHRGWQRLVLRSADLETTVWPELGGTISSLRRRRDNLELLCQPPWPLPPRGHPLPGGTAEVSRHDLDPGGWQSLFPNGGDAAEVDGAEWALDGEARVAPFEIVDGTTGHVVASNDADPTEEPATATGTNTQSRDDGVDGHVRLRARLRRCPAELTKDIRLDGSTVSVTETVRNVGAVNLEVMWGHQIRFGSPLIDAGAELDCPASFVHPDEMLTDDVDYEDVSPWPRTPGESSMINLRYLPEVGEETRLAYLSGLSNGTATVTNRQLGCAVTVQWHIDDWPHLWYAFEGGQTHDYPWFGNGHFLALTPNSSWPAHGLHDARRISESTLWIEPAQARSQTVTTTVSTVNP